MKKLANLFLLFTFLLISSVATAQSPEMADGLRADGKIYVVIAIIMIVLVGLILYLFLMDRKLSRMEEKLRQSGKTK